MRDMDTNMYERQDGSGLEIGSYAHRPILHDPDEIPSIEEAALSPTEFPFTQADFELQMEHALELMPEIVGDETVGVKYAINGLLSLTPDGMPILGETPEVKGLWSAAAVWVKEGPGVGKSVAEWMVHGESEIDLHSSDIARFHEHQKTRAHVNARARRGLQQDVRHRPPGRAVGVEPQRAAVAVPRARAASSAPSSSRPPAGSGRSGTSRTRRWSRSTATGQPARGRVGRALVVADHQRRAPGDARPRGDVRPVRVLHLRRRRPGRARGACSRSRCARWTSRSAASSTRRCSRRAAASSPTSRSCGSATSSSASSPAARTAWPTASGSPTTCPRTARRSSPTSRRPGRRSACGGRGRATSSRASPRDDVSHEGFPFGTCRTIEIGTLRVLASRISYVGDLGWELYVPIEQGARLWDLVWEAGEPHGLVPVGIGVYGTTGRLEKCYRAYGAELESEYNVVEAGMAGARSRTQDFVGKEAHLRHREAEPAAILCTLTVDDHTSRDGVEALHARPRADPDARRRAARPTRKGRRSYVTSAGAGPVDRQAHPDGLPAARARGRGRAAAVEYMGERYPVTVAVAGSTPVFDPENTRIRS